MITLMGAITVLGILPFAVYRLATGSVLAGSIELGIIAGIAGVACYAWLSGKTRLAAWLITILVVSGCLGIAMVLGRPGLMWMYAVILAAFLLLRHGEAALMTALALGALVIHGGAFESRFEMAMYLVTALVVALFAYIFAYRAEQMRGQLQALATRDPLTGVANRRSMEEEVLVAIETARRDRRPCGLAMIDLDHFKRINDRHGHAAGDRCLVDFAELLKSSTRKADRLFRFGGEEFVLLLPGADAAALEVILGHLRSRINGGFQCAGEAVTASMGAAELHADDRPEDWLHRADVALYQAKNGGRDRVVVSSVPPQGPNAGDPDAVDVARNAL